MHLFSSSRFLTRRLNSSSKFMSLSMSITTTPFPLVPPPSWKKLAPAVQSNTPIANAQATLTQLPVPELGATFERLRSSLRPLARSEEEYAVTVRKIEEFEKGSAPELQKRLLKRRDETEHWLEEWWDLGGYNGYRDSVVINVSYYYGFDAHPPQYEQTAAARAAALTRGVALFRRTYKRGELKPEATKEGPICMDTYRWMFDCCRIPGLEGADFSLSHAKSGDTGDTGHVIVLRKGRFWKLDLAKEGVLLSTADLQKQIQYIYDHTTEEYPSVGALTASNRDIWAKDHAELASSSHNQAILTAIHSSAFCLCLDTFEPSTSVEHSRALWHGADSTSYAGALANRWVDKPINLVVFDNAMAGIMGEHSVMDGTPTARMCDDVLDALAGAHGEFDHGSPATGSLTPPIPLDFDVTPKTQKAIEAAKMAAEDLCGGQSLGWFLTDYGKEAIKTFGVSPDSWAQMIVQLAYRRLLQAEGKKREGGTYEAASTRRFLKGRTEAIRVVSSESDAFVLSMDDPTVDEDERRRLFKLAASKHIQLAKEAGKAQGVDRHLLGLRKLVRTEEGESVPELYADGLYTRGNNWVLSTSAIFSKHFDVYGWGEVVPEGFGVAYMTGFEDKLMYTITSRKEMPNAQFCGEIQRASRDLYTLFARKSRL